MGVIGNWLYKGYEITEEEIRRAMAATKSNREAAKFLEVSYPTWKKYAKAYRDQETGKTLFELHYNASLKGVVGRSWVGGKIRYNWDNILIENQRLNPERLFKLKDQLVKYEKLEERCYRCDFSTRRLEDEKIPLMLNFKNGDKTNWKIQNLEFVCYNCAFLYCLDFYEDSVIKKVESLSISAEQGRKEKKEFFQLDDFYLDHIRQIGLEMSDEEILEVTNKEKADTGENDFIDFV